MEDEDFTFQIGTPGGNACQYDVYVNGFIEYAGPTGEGPDHIEGGFHAEGEVIGGWDTFEVKGWVTAINTSNGAMATLNDDEASFQDILEYRPDRADGSDGSSAGDSPSSRQGEQPPMTGDGDGPPATEPVGGEWNPSVPNEGRNLNPTYGIVNRPLVSADDMTMRIGEGEPFGTVQEALNQLPRYVEHEITLKLSRGVHGNEPGDSLNIPEISISAAGGRVQIVGDPTEPRQYAIDIRQANFQFSAGTAQDAQLKGVHMKGTIQNRTGPLELDRCVVSAGPRWNKGDVVPIDTYGGQVQALGTVIEGRNEAVNLVENASVSFNANCEIRVGGPLLSTGQGGGVIDFSGDVSVRGVSKLTEGWEPGTAIVRDGHGVTRSLSAGPHAVILG